MDSALIPKGVKRCSALQFILWIGANGAVLAWGVFAMLLVYIKGLNQTNMNNAYGFALWIWADLAVIALGGGAFFTGFLRYLVGKDELKNIINYAVLIGFICYSSALMILGFDIGQPLRGWFIFWHANVHSMLTEVAFCLTVYFGVLTIEYIPLILENRKLDKVPFFHNLSHNMHEIMAVFAATGAFLSFFHQGSLGGVPGVMFGRPFGFREGVLVWPWTFFLFTWSAAAFGPCFTIWITKITETITRKKLVKDNVIDLLAKISGWMIFSYIIAQQRGFSLWYLDLRSRSRHLRGPAGPDFDYAQIPSNPVNPLAGGHSRGHRCVSQSLGDGAAGPGHSGTAVRRLVYLYAKLARNCHHYFAGGLRRYYDLRRRPLKLPSPSRIRTIPDPSPN
jgi:molybdopterin-containing oxidoreductase family membrane subunit